MEAGGLAEHEGLAAKHALGVRAPGLVPHAERGLREGAGREQIEEALLRREHADLVASLLQTGHLRRELQGAVESPELVHEAELPGVRAGVDAALGEGAGGVRREAAPGGDAREEGGV